MWIINQAFVMKVLSMMQNVTLLFCSCILLYGVYLSAFPLPLCIHGISCPMGSTTSKCKIFSYAFTYDHCKEHMAITVCLCTHEGWE